MSTTKYQIIARIFLSIDEKIRMNKYHSIVINARSIFASSVVSRILFEVISCGTSVISIIIVNPATGGASQHNSMPVPSPGKWGGKPENPA